MPSHRFASRVPRSESSPPTSRPAASRRAGGLSLPAGFALPLALALALGARAAAQSPDPLGPEVEWTQSFAGRVFSPGVVAESSDGSFFISISTARGASVVMTTDGGETVWTAPVAPDPGAEVELTSLAAHGEGVVLTGVSFGSDGNVTSFVSLLDSQGEVAWTHFAPPSRGIFSVTGTRDGGAVAVGVDGITEEPKARSASVYLAKLNAFGELEWEQSFPAADGSFEGGYAVVELRDGGFAIAGEATRTITDFEQRLIVLKTDAGGDLVLHRDVETENTYASDLAEAADGGLVIATRSSLLKTNGSGELVWELGMQNESTRDGTIARTVESTVSSLSVLPGGTVIAAGRRALREVDTATLPDGWPCGGWDWDWNFGFGAGIGGWPCSPGDPPDIHVSVGTLVLLVGEEGGIESESVLLEDASQHGVSIRATRDGGAVLATTGDKTTGAEDTSLLVKLAPVRPAGAPRFRRGDADGNGGIELTDAIASLEHQFRGAEPPACLDALDFDDSGDINLSDPIATILFLFLGGSEPPPPFTACGLDPTADAIPCAASQPCR